MMRLAAPFAAVVVMAGCATQAANEQPKVVRSRAPVSYESTISSYFDLTGAPLDRKIAYGAPETSPCALVGGGGRHLGWVVPVVYDTSPSNASSNTKPVASGKPAAVKLASSGTGTGPISLDQVSISGTRYFFWFSSDTLSAVTRRADQCP